MINKLLLTLLVVASGAFAYTDPESGITFPPALGGLTFQSREDFKRPGFGYSVRYSGPEGSFADVYVYDELQEKIPEGIVSPLIQDQLRSVGESMIALAERRKHQDVKLVAKGVASETGAVPFAWSKHQYKSEGRTWISHTMLTGFHDHFIKVRLTFLADSHAADGFPTALAALLDASRPKPYMKPPTPKPEAPSASDVKQRVVALCGQLESNPFAQDARELRSALYKYFKEAPDITITVESKVIGKLDGIDNELAAVLIGSDMFAMGCFLIENPDRAKDSVAVQTAGLEGLLRTYEVIKGQRPGWKLPSCEAFLEMKSKGTLASHVKSSIKKR